MKIKSNTTKKDLPWRFGVYQRHSSEENGTNSFSGSCHGSDVTWQEICRLWLTIPVATITWLTGYKLQFWIGSLTEVSDGSKRRCTFQRKDEVLWTGMRAAKHWATRTTDFLPRHITTVARTGRRISSIFFWRRPL